MSAITNYARGENSESKDWEISCFSLLYVLKRPSQEYKAYKRLKCYFYSLSKVERWPGIFFLN